MKKILTVAVFFVVVIYFLSPAAYAKRVKKYILPMGAVQNILDAKTFRVKGKGKVVLIGIEIIPQMNNKVLEILNRHLKGRVVDLETDAKEFVRGRRLVYLYCNISGFSLTGHTKYFYDLFTRKKKLFLNAYLIAQGLARPVDSSPNTRYSKLFSDLYKEAKRNKVGIWKYSR